MWLVDLIFAFICILIVGPKNEAAEYIEQWGRDFSGAPFFDPSSDILI